MIETERLTLRDWQESDVRDLFEFSKNANMLMAGAKTHESIEESFECIHSFIKSQEIWAVSLNESGKVIGWIGLYDTDRHDHYKEMEYVISEFIRTVGLLQKQ